MKVKDYGFDLQLFRLVECRSAEGPSRDTEAPEYNRVVEAIKTTDRRARRHLAHWWQEYPGYCGMISAEGEVSWVNSNSILRGTKLCRRTPYAIFNPEPLSKFQIPRKELASGGARCGALYTTSIHLAPVYHKENRLAKYSGSRDNRRVPSTATTTYLNNQ